MVKVYDGNTLGLVATVNIPESDAHPYIETMSGAVNPATNKVYIAWTGKDNINIIDGATNTIVLTVLFTAFSEEIAVNPYTNLLYMKEAIYNGDTLAAVGQSYPGDVLTIDAIHNFVYTADAYTLNVLNGVTQGVVASLKFNWYLDSYDTVAAVNPTTSKLYIGGGTSNQTTVVTISSTPAPSPTPVPTQPPTPTYTPAPTSSPVPTPTQSPPSPSTVSPSTSPSPNPTVSLMPTPSSTPSPSPTIPELPALAVLALLSVLLLVAAVVRYRHKRS